MAGSLLPEPKQQFFDDIGAPLFAGKIFTYEAGTLTPKATYQDQALTISNTNPVIANARGEVVMYGDGNYRVILKNLFDVTIYDRDNISAFDFSGANGSDMIGNGGETVAQSFNALQLADYGALRAYSGPRKSVYVTGYKLSASPSGIAGWFVADPNDNSSIDNGGSIIVASNGMRWKRQFTGPIEVDWFGAFGVADSKPAIMGAIAAAEATPGGSFIAFRAGGTYVMLSGLTFNCCKVGMIGRGATLDCRSFTTQTLFTPNQTGIEVDQCVGLAHMHPVHGFRLLGPGFAVSGAKCIVLRVPAGETPVLAGMIFSHLVFNAWATDIEFGRGSFFTTVEHSNFQGINGAGTDTMFSINSLFEENSGERTTFRNCTMGARGIGYAQANPNADFLFDDCSWDYFGGTAMALFAGTTTLIGGHTEIAHDTDHWFKISGADTLLVISPSHTIVLAGVKNAFAPFVVSADCTRGGIIGSGWKLIGGDNPHTSRLIDGDGRTKVSNITHSLSTTYMITSSYQNVLSYPSFENSLYTSEWVLAGTTPPAISTDIARTGLYSLKFAPLPAAAVITSGLVSTSCKPGDFVAIEFYYLTNSMAGSGATFSVSASYTDKAGNDISTGQQLVVQTSDVGVWTKVVGGLPIAAPAGAYGYRAFFSVFGVTSGTPRVYVDDVIITVS